MYNSYNNKSLNDLKKFIIDKKFKKIFVLTGNNSYFKSGANKIFDKLLSNKTNLFYFKKSFYPEIDELKKIIQKLNIFKPDLIIAVGGGCVIDYAKIASVINLNSRLKDDVINSSYIIKKKI